MLITTSQPQSGSYVTFAFDKEALKLISKVALDPIYSVEANWKLVTLVFKQSNGNKKFTSAFRDFVNPKNSKLRSGMMSGDSMQLQKIIISKTNRQHLVIYRSEISGAASFDFTLANSFQAPPSSVTSYQYYKMAVKSAWFEVGSLEVRKVVSFSDVAFKDASGNTISMSGASLANIFQSSNYGAANLIDGIVEQSNANDIRVYDMPNMTLYHDLFTITMASAVSVSKLLIGAQGGTATSYNMPREFKLLASNDNINFTEIFVSTPDANTDVWNNYKGQYREFTI
jgi:hypothetical protein